MLPGTRPLKASYGPTLSNDKPIENPELELDANDLEKIKADLAYVARMTPLLRVRVLNSGSTAGSPAVAHVCGPEDVETGHVTVTWQNDGLVRVDISGTGVTIEDVVAQALKVSGKLMTAHVEILTATTFEVQTWDHLSGETDADFVALVY